MHVVHTKAVVDRSTSLSHVTDQDTQDIYPAKILPKKESKDECLNFDVILYFLVMNVDIKIFIQLIFLIIKLLGDDQLPNSIIIFDINLLVDEG